MSRTTIFKEGAWVSGYEYSDKDTLQRDIDKKEADVNYYKEKLLALCCATPKDITPKDGEPLHFVTREFEDVWDELQEEMFSLAAMYFVQHNEEYINKDPEIETESQWSAPTTSRAWKGGIGPDYYDMKFR